MRQVERWARKTQIAKMLSFFDELPRFIHVPKAVLLGSNNNHEILIEGDTTTSRVRDVLANLDEPFNPHLANQRFLGGQKREKSAGALPSVYQQLQKGFPELCLLKGTGQCGDKIVRAHSVQKALFKNHAKNGHVYQFDLFTGPHDEDKRLWPDLTGINKATTFTGFCDLHDSQVFSPIENAPFQNTPEQTFLYHYRAFAQAYYCRAHGFRIIEDTYKELAQKLPPVELKSIKEKVELNRKDVLEFQPQKEKYEQNLKDKDWSRIEGHAFVGETMPDILSTDYFGPRKDFQGRRVQDCKTFGPLAWVSMTVIASNDRAVLLLCGEKGSRVLHQLVDSFRKLPATERTRAIVTYVFCQFENFVLLPKWWESLSKEVQLRFVNAFEGRYYPRDLPHTCDWRLNEFILQN